jgi:hypothetical protein
MTGVPELKSAYFKYVLKKCENLFCCNLPINLQHFLTDELYYKSTTLHVFTKKLHNDVLWKK